jgi:hypothetical protein
MFVPSLSWQSDHFQYKNENGMTKERERDALYVFRTQCTGLSKSGSASSASSSPSTSVVAVL